MKTAVSLEDQIKALHEQLDVVINDYVDGRAAACVGVPRGSVEASIIHRASGCKCAEFRLVQKRIADEEELARRQQEDALHEG
jgi:hypothetical protein